MLRATSNLLRAFKQHVAGNKCYPQHVACCPQQVACPRNLLPGNMLRWCKRGIKACSAALKGSMRIINIVMWLNTMSQVHQKLMFQTQKRHQLQGALPPGHNIGSRFPHSLCMCVSLNIDALFSSNLVSECVDELHLRIPNLTRVLIKLCTFGACVRV